MNKVAKMKPHEIYAAAWIKAAEIISDVDMDDYEDDQEIIDAMYSLADTFREQAQQLILEQEMLERVHAHAMLKEPIS